MILPVLHSPNVAFGTSARGSAINPFVILNTAHEAGDIRADGQFLMGEWSCDALARLIECARPGFAPVRVFRKKYAMVREHARSVVTGEFRVNSIFVVG